MRTTRKYGNGWVSSMLMNFKYHQGYTVLDKLTRDYKEYLDKLINSFYYIGGSLIQFFISLITFPIYIKYLSAVDFGIFGFYESITQFFTPIFVLSTTNIYVMKYFRQNELENKKFLFNILYFLTLLNTFTYLISYFGLQVYFVSADVSVPFYPYTLIILTSIFLGVFRTFTLLNFRIRREAKSFFLLACIHPVLDAVFSILFIVKFDGGVEGRIAGTLVSRVIVAVVCIYILRKYTIYKIEFSVFKRAISLAFPLIISAYAYIPIMSLDKLFLERLGDIAELGIYTVGSQVAHFLNVAFVAVFNSFEPDLYKSVIESNKNKTRNNLIIFIIIIASGLCFFLLISKFLLSILAREDYSEAYIYANYLAVGYFFLMLSSVVSSMIMALEKPKLASTIIYAGGIASLFLYKIMIDYKSFMGAVYAKVIVSIIMVSIGFFLLATIKKTRSDASN